MYVRPAWRTLCLAALVIGVFSACEDPSNVGIGLVDEEEGGLPEVRNVDLMAFRSASLPRANGSAPRVITGQVEDPLIGTTIAEGYVDLSSSASAAFRANEVESANLRLVPTYVYGDTIATVRLAIRQITEEWRSTNLPADTTFGVGEIVAEFELTPTDSLVVIPLPESWVSENESALRSEDFADLFHGFRFEQVAGNAVVGFGGGSQMRAFTESDSAVFPINRAYSAARRLSEAAPPERLLYQASAGPMLAFEVNLDQDAVRNAAINQARLVFYTDQAALESTPTHFVRPLVTTLDLYGILEDDRLVLIDRADIDEQGRFIFEGSGLASEMQAVLLGTRAFDRFELRLPVGQATFGESALSAVLGSASVQLFYEISAEERSPMGFFTVTPLD